MTVDRQGFMREQLRKLRSENLKLRERLNVVKKEGYALQQALKNEQRILNEAPAPFLIVQDEKIGYANEVAAEALSYTPGEMIGRSFLELVRPDLVQYVRDLHRRRLMGRPVPDQYETSMVSKHGESRCFQVRVQRSRYRGRKCFIFGLIPLDEWKETQELHCLNQKREALGRMAVGIGSEIAPVTDLLVEGEGAIRSLEAAMPSGLEAVLEKVSKAWKRLDCLDRRLAGLSQAPYRISSLAPFDLRRVVQDVVSMIRPRLDEDRGKEGAAVRIKTYLRSLSQVEGRPDEIRDALREIILNSVEALPEGGDVYVTTEEDAGYANVYVQDNGSGVSAQIQDKIFDPFFSTKGDGRAGLGLTLAHAAIYRHGGAIDLRSREGEGTTILIQLPLPSEPPLSKKRRSRKKLKNSHIIMLTLDDMAGPLLSELFSGKGGRVTLLSTPAQCVRELKKGRADVVIVDGEIREEGFLRFMKEFRKENSEVPVVVISSPGGEDPSRPSGTLEGDLVIGRPLDLDLILRQVIDAMNAEGRGER